MFCYIIISQDFLYFNIIIVNFLYGRKRADISAPPEFQDLILLLLLRIRKTAPVRVTVSLYHMKNPAIYAAAAAASATAMSGSPKYASTIAAAVPTIAVI